MVMSEFYLPRIKQEFQLNTEVVFNYRTQNMTSSICTRLDGFESNLRMNTYKLAALAQDAYNTTYVPDEYPYQLGQALHLESKFHQKCSFEQSEDQKYKANELEPLWKAAFDT